MACNHDFKLCEASKERTQYSSLKCGKCQRLKECVPTSRRCSLCLLFLCADCAKARMDDGSGGSVEANKTLDLSWEPEP